MNNQTILQTESTSQKLNGILNIGLTIIYTFLFYDQNYGINYLLFSLVALGAFIWRNPKLLKSKQFVAISIGTVFTGWTSFYLGTWYQVLMNKLSLLILASLSIQSSASLVFGLIQSMINLAISPIRFLGEIFNFKSSSASQYSRWIKYGILTIVPIVISLIFLGIYASSNPILFSFISKFNWNFISIGCLLFIGYSLIFNYGLFKQISIEKIEKLDQNTPNDITVENSLIKKSVFDFLNIDSKIYIAVAVFILLNVVIGLNNGLDIYYLFIVKVLPLGLSNTDFLHQGVNALIISIFMAIGLIVFFFNSSLNFVKQAKWIKLVAYLWIAQNIVLVGLCLHKNIAYIAEFGLTYKRIGVYTFLFLAMIGLGFTLYKILKNKSLFYLIRRNSWAAYITLSLLGSYDWDFEMTKHNLTVKKDNHIDYDYLLNIDYSGLPLLKNHFETNPQLKLDSVYSYDESLYQNLKISKFDKYNSKLNTKIDEFKTEMKPQTWQSTCILKSKTNLKLQ